MAPAGVDAPDVDGAAPGDALADDWLLDGPLLDEALELPVDEPGAGVWLDDELDEEALGEDVLGGCGAGVDWLGALVELCDWLCWLGDC